MPSRAGRETGVVTSPWRFGVGTAGAQRGDSGQRVEDTWDVSPAPTELLPLVTEAAHGRESPESRARITPP